MQYLWYVRRSDKSFTTEVTLQSRDHTKKLMVPELIKKFPHCIETEDLLSNSQSSATFIYPQLYTNPAHSIPSYLRTILILSSSLRMRL